MKTLSVKQTPWNSLFTLAYTYIIYLILFQIWCSTLVFIYLIFISQTGLIFLSTLILSFYIDIDFTLSTRMLATLCNWNHLVIRAIDWKNLKENFIFTNFNSHQHLNLPCPTTVIIRPKLFFFSIGSVNTSSYSIGITLQGILTPHPHSLHTNNPKIMGNWNHQYMAIMILETQI